MAETTYNDVVWTRIDGMIVAAVLDPHEVAEYLRGEGVIAALHWYESTPHLLSISLAVASGRVAILPTGSPLPLLGPEVEEFAWALATEFYTEVMLPGVTFDFFPADAQVPALAETDRTVVRAVEISPVEQATVPMLAAFERLNIGSLEVGEDRLALFTAVPEDANRSAEVAAETPLVALQRLRNDEVRMVLDRTGQGGDDQYLKDDAYLVYAWGKQREFVYGNVDVPTQVLKNRVASLVGPKEELNAMADAVPGTSRNALHEAVKQENPEAGLRAACRAFGLPAETADMLMGRIEVTEIPGIEMHQARGISNAIGRAVDMMMEEPNSLGSKFWGAYHTVAVEKPWVVRAAASLEAAAGAVLLANALRHDGKRSGWGRLGGVAGALMVLDSLGEIFLAKLLSARAERHAARVAE